MYRALHNCLSQANIFNYSRRRESREYRVHPRLCVCLSVCLSARQSQNG